MNNDLNYDESEPVSLRLAQWSFEEQRQHKLDYSLLHNVCPRLISMLLSCCQEIETAFANINYSFCITDRRCSEFDNLFKTIRINTLDAKIEFEKLGLIYYEKYIMP